MRMYTLVLLVALVGCKKPREAPPAGAGSATPVSVAADAETGSGQGSAADSAQAADVDVPTEVDFEDQATAEIDDKNVEARVKAIEQELAQ